MTDSAVRPARPDDVPAVLGLVRELAAYERALDQVQATEEQLAAALFGEEPRVHAHVVEHDGAVAGFALWFLSFSTWQGRHGIYLEDLYVRPGHRGGGAGAALLAELARICVERGYRRLDWVMLDWNPAADFYAAIGASASENWLPYRLTGAALHRLAERASPVRR